MKPYFLQAFYLLALFSLVSCGSGGKTNAKIEVSHSFSAADFSGGLIIIGSNETVGKKVSIALDATLQKTIELEKGIWTFAAVGWDGATKFAGNQLCGTTKADLTTDSATVELIVNAANCTAIFDSKMAIRNLMVTTCGLFYAYDPTADTYGALNGTSAHDTFCNNTLMDYRSSFTHFRLFSVNHYTGTSAAGFSSPCLAMTAANRLKIPTLLMPFVVRTYKSADECNLFTAKSLSFTFPDGIAAGDPATYEHHYMPTDTAPEARLVLPSSMTRRGRSPFMANIPRMLCSTADCVPDPIFNLANHHVDWFWNQNGGGGDRNKTLVKKTNVTSCPADFLANLDYFNLLNCQVNEGRIEGEFAKNALTCQKFSQPYTGVLDIVRKNGKIYLLYFNSVKILSEGGIYLGDQSAPSGGTKLAVSDNQDIYILKSSVVAKMPYNAVTKSYGPDVDPLIVSTFDDIEAYGNFLYLTAGGQLSTYTTAGAFIDQSPEVLTPAIKQLVFLNNFVHVILSDGTATGVKKYPIDNLGFIGVSTAPLTAAAFDTISASYDNGKFYLFHSSNYEVYDENYAFIKTVTVPAALTSGANNFIKVKDLAYFVQPGNIKSGKEAGTSMTAKNLYDTCIEPASWTIGSQTGSISLQTEVSDTTYRLFNDLIDFFGRRTLTDSKALTYFESLSHGNDDDENETGGRLGNVQQMLGPQGIGSLFWDFGSCESLRNSMPTGGSVARSVTLYEPGTTKKMVVNVEAKRLLIEADHAVEAFLGTSSDPTSVSNDPSTSHYDLEIFFTTANDQGEKERSQMKLLCGTKIGKFERVNSENSATEISRAKILYNTQLPATQRYEQYERHDDSGDVYLSITRAMKQGTNYWGKMVDAKFDINGISSTARETHLDSTPTPAVFMSSAFRISSDLTFFPGTHGIYSQDGIVSFDNVRDQLSFEDLALPPVGCMPAGNTNVIVANDPGCSSKSFLVIDPNRRTSSFLYINPISLFNARNTTLNYPSSVFTLPAP